MARGIGTLPPAGSTPPRPDLAPRPQTPSTTPAPSQGEGGFQPNPSPVPITPNPSSTSGGLPSASPTIYPPANFSNMKVGYFKINLELTKTNIYGESLEKWYYPPANLPCIITRNDFSYPDDEFGINVAHSITVTVFEDTFISFNFRPEVGDIMLDQERHYELNNINQNLITLPGSNVGAAPTVLIQYVLSGNLTRTTKLNLIEYYQ